MYLQLHVENQYQLLYIEENHTNKMKMKKRVIKFSLGSLDYQIYLTLHSLC